MTRTLPTPLIVAASLLLAALSPSAPLRADTAALAALAEPGHVLILRHALAPGTGDPGGFDLDDCSTQRTLDDVGRDQARALGARLRDAGIDEARVFSSQWCRCLETAELLGLGPVRELPALNSFFGRNRADEEMRVAALRDFLGSQPLDGPPLVLVTHQVTVTAITGDFIRSGEGHVLKLDGTGRPPVVGRVRVP